MFKKLGFISLFAITFCLYSCETVEIETLTSKNVSISTPQQSIIIQGHFKERVKYWFSIAGLVNLNKPDFDRIFAEQIMKYNGDGICNLRLKDQYGFTDILITLAGEGIGFQLDMGKGVPMRRELQMPVFMRWLYPF